MHAQAEWNLTQGRANKMASLRYKLDLELVCGWGCGFPAAEAFAVFAEFDLAERAWEPLRVKSSEAGSIQCR